MTVLDQIAARIAGGCPITPADRRAAVEAIIDTLACIVAGRDDDATRAVIAAKPATGGPCDSVAGATDAATAALINGVAGHALDFDDNFGPGMSHASAVMVPALIAVGQQTGVTGRQLVDAYLAGLEAQALVGQGVRPQHYTAGWHGTSTIAPIGTAAGAAMLIGADGVQAMSLAVSTACGPKGQFGTSAKPFHAGAAARNATEAALLARAGLRGRADILEGPQGFGELFGAGVPAIWDIVPDAPHVIGVEGLSPKLHPCCGSTHNAIDMLHDLRRDPGFAADDVAHITIAVALANYRNLAYPDPQTEMEARFSMQYCLARALHQDVLSLADFTPAAIFAPHIRADMAKVEMTLLPENEQAAALKAAHRMTVRLKDGRVAEAARSHARGTIRDPLTPDQRRAKFADCTGRPDLHDRLQDLDALPDLRLLGEVLRLQPA
ncbi:MmgE/PrpD family protein [Falsirhodobacter halotolerans]|uniref:MmgE/PrpD family protein n=1 Tax=Falsirhodobacter halotolerans TaxID=1146892 RepID=UPI001FD57584|nr:MmgE/PrpD family protein [Falsirhodobacter halotolerans]MCJ8140887.1 MmgE/PrpD family protein [Falsirhodobacter halotolerans]